MQNLKNFSSTLLNTVSTNIIKVMPCVSSNGTRISEIDNRLAEINNTVKQYEKKISFVAMGVENGMLNQEQIDKINSEIDTQASEITAMQAEKISLESEKDKLIADTKGKYKLFDSKLRDSVTCGEKSTPKAYKIKQLMLTVINAVMQADDDDLEDVDDDDVELGVKSAISQYYTQTSGKSGRYTYIRKYNLEDDTDAVKKSIDEKLGTIVNPLR